MPNRRKFILQTVAAGGVLGLPAIQPASARDVSRSAVTPLRVLILGGTGFIGPHFVRAAADRGHRVAVFNRGKSRRDLPGNVERLTGDRNGDLESIKRREWDAVFDLAAYVPNWVRTLGAALRGRVQHYTFISTNMTYQIPGATATEGSKLVGYTGSNNPYSASSLENPKDYGALKALCEQEGERQFPGKMLVVRPGNIVGPGERVGAFTYWVARMERGGEVLAGGDPLTQVQLIDARDLAEWAVRLAEQRKTGAFNVAGPAMPLGWAEMLGAIRGNFSVPTRLTWVPGAWLKDQQIKPTSATLFWPSEFGIPGMWQLPIDKALASGLSFRSLNITVADTLAWYKSLPREEQKNALLSFDDKNRTLGDALTREMEVLATWRAQSVRK